MTRSHSAMGLRVARSASRTRDSTPGSGKPSLRAGTERGGAGGPAGISGVTASVLLVDGPRVDDVVDLGADGRRNSELRT